MSLSSHVPHFIPLSFLPLSWVWNHGVRSPNQNKAEPLGLLGDSMVWGCLALLGLTDLFHDLAHMG